MADRQAQREKVIQALADHLLANGLGQTSLRQLAAACDTSDRMLLYYFTDKAEIMTTVLSRVTEQFSVALDQALPAREMAPHDLLLKATALVRTPAMRPTMRLWLDMVAAAAREEPPFPAIATSILHQLMHWIEVRLEGPAGEAKRQRAAFLLAVIDGIAMFDMKGGLAEADAAEAALANIEML